MLNILHIENIAVIEQAEILFDSGLNVLTGETGAGKSIVIDSISALLGERTNRDLIRTGCTKAAVSGIFSHVPKFPWFADKNIPYDEAELFIQREISADGRNLCRVNGLPVSVSVLRELGRQLIQIHSQNETQLLFDEQTHLGYLDMTADNDDALAHYRGLYDTYADLHRQLEQLAMDESARLRRIETLRFQTEEIRGAALVLGEEDELQSRKRILLNAEKLSAGLSEALGAISGAEDSDGAADLIAGAQKALSRLGNISEEYRVLAEELADLRYNLLDISDRLYRDRDDIAYSAGELEEIELRLETISRMRKKYGATVEEVLSFCQAAEEELSTLEQYDSTLSGLQKALQQAENAARDAGLILRNLRQEAAVRLQERIESELRQLDMPNIAFRCQFDETPLTRDGLDFVRFYMSANAGETLKPLSKVASGGELARIMLALKNVLAEKESAATMIFDEVDSGVSGRAAQKVAVKLRSVAKSKQVFCVTHLPQIAAAASTHLRIYKEVRDGRTYTSVVKLERQGRIEELSRIIGGADITENTRRSAEDMLAAEF